ncbi:MAG: hypothetical protein PVF63_03390 [Gammaproteobacteria bacterium]
MRLKQFIALLNLECEKYDTGSYSEISEYPNHLPEVYLLHSSAQSD